MEDSKVSRKRRFEEIATNIQDSPYYKLRVLLKDLRPHFIQVLKTPDFQNCKAAGSICQGMKLFIDQYKSMISESIKLETRNNNNPPDYSSPNAEHQQDVKPIVTPLHQSGGSVGLSDRQTQGSYIIGGSAVGWNFIMFNSNIAIYYGRTKEDFRAANPKSTEGQNSNS